MAPVKSTPKRAASDAKQYYQVVHGAVGQWAQGTIITSDDLAGIDVDRLLRLGAITETEEPREPEPVVEDEAPPAE